MDISSGSRKSLQGTPPSPSQRDRAVQRPVRTEMCSPRHASCWAGSALCVDWCSVAVGASLFQEMIAHQTMCWYNNCHCRKPVPGAGRPSARRHSWHNQVAAACIVKLLAAVVQERACQHTRPWPLGLSFCLPSFNSCNCFCSCLKASCIFWDIAYDVKTRVTCKKFTRDLQAYLAFVI